MIPRLNHFWSTDSYPYETLEGSGITPGSTHEEVLDLGLALQSAGKMTQDARRAWDELRLPARRLATDFFLYAPALATPIESAQAALRAFAQGHGLDLGSKRS